MIGLKYEVANLHGNVSNFPLTKYTSCTPVCKILIILSEFIELPFLKCFGPRHQSKGNIFS